MGSNYSPFTLKTMKITTQSVIALEASRECARSIHRQASALQSLETYQVIQVRGGKFHRPEKTNHERGLWFKPMNTACGATVTPLNVFSAVDDAMSYTGGREEFFCQKCFKHAETLDNALPCGTRVRISDPSVTVHGVTLSPLRSFDWQIGVVQASWSNGGIEQIHSVRVGGYAARFCRSQLTVIGEGVKA